MPIETYPVISSNVLELSYEPETQTVYVTFHKGGIPTSTHKYWPVERADFDTIRTSSSVGKAVNQFLVRSNIYSHGKVTD